MVSKTSIKLDTSNGKIKVYNNRVYLKIKSEWDEKKKHSIKDRVCIGLIDTSDRTKFFPNNSYYGIFNKGKAELKELSPHRVLFGTKRSRGKVWCN